MKFIDAIAKQAREMYEGIAYPTISTKNEAPEVTIRFAVGGSEGCEVTIDLIDTGNDEDGRPTFDADIHIGNDDSTGPIYMSAALAVCVQKFYDMGLDTRFGHITGKWEKDGI